MNKRGFTVLETIVAIMVASLAIAGATMAARGGIRAGSIAKEEVRAFYLAQEVLDVLNNKRDSNELYNTVNGVNTDWRTGIYDPSGSGLCSIGNKCYLDMNWLDVSGVGPVFLTCGGSCDDEVLRQHKTDGRYGYGPASDWKVTPYVREIEMEKDGNDRLVVSILIRWNHAGSLQQFRVKTLVSNWYTSSTSE